MYDFLFNIETTIFKDDLKNAIVCRKLGDFMETGNAIRKNKYIATVCAIGEAYEREALMQQHHKQLSTNFYAFSLFDKSKYQFSFEELQQRNIFFDTCGCAAHITSYDCIEKAFFEFLERQSFIFWYLSKEKSYIVNKNILEHYENYKRLFCDFDCYEISLINSFYVVFFIGELKNKLAVSLGAGKTLDVAIDSGLSELNQMLSAIINDVQIDKTQPKDYFETYYSIPTEKLKIAYSFIKKKCS